jgi:hypothetical protein
MANKTIVGFYDSPSGVPAGSKALVFPPESLTPINTADAVTSGTYNSFSFVLTESLTAGVTLYRVLLVDASNAPISSYGWVYLPSDTLGTYYIDNLPKLDVAAFTANAKNLESPIRDVADPRPIEFDWQAGATFADGDSTRIFPGQSSTAPLSGAITQIRSGRYSIAYNIADRAADATTIVPTEVTYRLVDDNGNSGDLTLRIIELTGGATTGTGSNQLAVTITDGTSAIAGAIVSAKQSGIVKAWGYSNGAGLVTFALASGTYSIEVQNQPGFAPQSPASVTVPASSTLTITLTAQAISPPTTPGLCTVRFAVLDNGTAVQGAIVQVELEDINPTVNTALVSRVIHSGTTNSSGYVDLVMIQKTSVTRGGFYRIRVSDAGGRRLHDRRVYVPTSSTMFAEDLPDAEDFPT